MKEILFVVAILFAATTVSAQEAKQSPPTTQNRTQDNGSLAKPVDWGVFTTRLFTDSPRVSFSLSTSWIPGENHKGMMRYKLNAVPEKLLPLKKERDTAEIEATEKVLNSVNSCLITVDLYDSDGFSLRKISIAFSRGVDDHAQLMALTSNDSVQMDAQEYRSFIGSKGGKAGAWSVSWACEPSN